MKPNVSLSICAALERDGSVLLSESLQIHARSRCFEMPPGSTAEKWQAAGFTDEQIEYAQEALPALRRALAAKLEGS